jgi:1H-pyrrole-2-carbonyl-[peptidyl-carrier protein] brominase
MKTSVAIIGGGPGGATAALYMLREGIQPVIIEKEAFPRYHIGESMTGECGGVVRDLGLADVMLEKNYPVKHGVKVFGKHPWFLPVMKRNKAGELEDLITWQVRRSDFDKMLLEEAISRGAILVNGQATDPVVDDNMVVKGVDVRMADGGIQRIESDLLLDCSGGATFLATKGITGPKYMGSYDKQIAIFSQVAGAIRDHGEARDMQPGNTLIFYRSKYNWGWWIPIDDDATSVGIVIPAAYFISRGETKTDFLKRELHEMHPELTDRLPSIDFVEETHVIKNYSYQVKNFTGPGYICLGDAHRFVDPIFSFGLYVAMKEAQIASPYIVDYLNGGRRKDEKPFEDYQVYAEKGIDVLEDVLDGFWEHPFAFATLVYHKYFDQMVDIFAGRIYEDQPSPATESFRKLLKRERAYDSTDDYSVPIGSRYHEERANIWNEDPVGEDELSELLA